MNQSHKLAWEAIKFLDRCKIDTPLTSDDEPSPQGKLLAEAYFNVKLAPKMQRALHEAAVAIYDRFIRCDY